MSDPIENLKDAMRAKGINPPANIIADGAIHRFPTNGHARDDSGWYILHTDGFPAGAFGDWRSDVKRTWRADLGRELNPAESQAHRKRMDAINAARKADDLKRHAEAADKALQIWRAAQPCESNPYLERKGVCATQTLKEIEVDAAAAILGYSPKSRGELLSGRILLAPVKIGDAISTLEMIDGEGRKSALFGGAKGGGYWAAQPMPDSLEMLLIGEGVATVLSVHEATGHPAIAALSSGNLEAVARLMRERYPVARLVILADTGNGQTKAHEAASAVGGSVVLPEFTPDELAADKPPTDFNDMAALRGLDAVAALIRGADCAAGGGEAVAPANDPIEDFDSSLTEPAPTVSLLRASDIIPEPINWLWPGWLAAGKMHILGGAPGTGKTTIAMALAGTISTGGRWPDGSRSQTGNVIIWSGEDDPSDTLVPRLALAGADLNKVFFVADVREGGKSRSFDPARDIEALRRKLIEIGGVKLLIVDPIVSAITGDSHKNAEVRRGLQPLADLAVSMKCALLGITHFSKGTGGRDPVERITGSLAFGAMARVVMVAAKHLEQSDDGGTKRILLRAKSNIGPDDGGFEYDFQQAELKSMPGISASTVRWGGVVEGHARDLLAAAEAVNDDSDDDGGALGDAKQFLLDLLADGPQPARVIRAEAIDAGHSQATLRRAKTDLGITTKKIGVKGGWEWQLPRRCSIKSEDAHQNSVSTFGDFEHLGGSAGELEAEV